MSSFNLRNVRILVNSCNGRQQKIFPIKCTPNTQLKTNHCQLFFLILIGKKIACTQTQHLLHSTDDNYQTLQLESSGPWTQIQTSIPRIRQYCNICLDVIWDPFECKFTTKWNFQALNPVTLWIHHEGMQVPLNCQ
jgi:hypothetical protein